MERDFLGLSSKEPLAVVKEEVINDGFKEIGFTKGSRIQWPFSNKVTALPHFKTFKAAHEDKKTKKIVSDTPTPPGFMPISIADAYDHNQKCAEIQKSFNQDRQGGTHISLTAYSVQQHDVHSLHRSHDVKTFPVSNQAVSVSVNKPFFKNHFANMCQNLVGANMQQQLLGGVPVLHSVSPTVGITEPWSTFKANGSAAPAQLTIFYGGTVNVFDEISPEKAQAIMLLAGNGTLMTPTIAQPKAQVQAPSSKPATVDGVTVNQTINTPPGSALSSPISAQSGSGSTNTEQPTTGVATTPICKLEPLTSVNAMGSVATTSMMPSGHSTFYTAIPQARKASLASFLEKRKQRVMNTSPYNNINKKSPECSTLVSSGMNF